jgi:hypothetical protein
VIEINKINMYYPGHGNLNTVSLATCSKGRDVGFGALAAYAQWHSGSCIIKPNLDRERFMNHNHPGF